MGTLIITEKPKVSRRIAYALSKECRSRRVGRVSYYELRVNGETVYVASAAGHLYSLKERKSSRSYPVFDVEWAPLYEIEKGKGYTRAYIRLLEELAKRVERFIIATDYDIEGELLGYNALRFACSASSAKRMRFSALTKVDILKAYRDLAEVDLLLVKAGETRHIMDWYWGINTSRALTDAVKRCSNRFITFSAGRVQTPALAILVQREREIASFTPEKFWTLSAVLLDGRSRIKAAHVEGRIRERSRAQELHERLKKAKKARVVRAEYREVEQLPPPPFDLGTLQSEAYRHLRLSPKQCQDLAQNLYESGYISYPRTSSQKLPPTIGYRRIIQELEKNPEFRELAGELLGMEKLRPRQGGKEDPAHPAIYPTGTKPKKLPEREAKLYELIVRRFLACFAGACRRRVLEGEVEIEGERFRFALASTLEQGWRRFYPYGAPEEHRIPEIEPGDVLEVKEVVLEEGETEPPRRYNPATLVAELERRGLGTKATRAEVVDTLYRREYITGVQIRVTPIGMSVIEALERHVPEIISEELTRRFEQKIERIQRGEEDPEKTLAEARAELERIIGEFKRHLGDIGRKLSEAVESKRSSEVVGRCPRCGRKLRIIRSKKTGKRFIGCEGYPECSTSFPLLQRGRIEPTDRTCESCGLPMVSVGTGKRRTLRCIDINCGKRVKAEDGR